MLIFVGYKQLTKTVKVYKVCKVIKFIKLKYEDTGFRKKTGSYNSD